MHIQSHVVPDGVRQIGINSPWRPLAQDALGNRFDAVSGWPAQRHARLDSRDGSFVGLEHRFVQQTLFFAEASADRDATSDVGGVACPFATGVNEKHLPPFQAARVALIVQDRRVRTCSDDWGECQALAASAEGPADQGPAATSRSVAPSETSVQASRNAVSVASTAACIAAISVGDLTVRSADNGPRISRVGWEPSASTRRSCRDCSWASSARPDGTSPASLLRSRSRVLAIRRNSAHDWTSATPKWPASSGRNGGPDHLLAESAGSAKNKISRYVLPPWGPEQSVAPRRAPRAR